MVKRFHGVDLGKVKAEAEKEVAEEKSKEAKGEVKALLRKLDDAEKVVANIKREIEDLYAEISEN